MKPFWGSLFEHLKDCGRNATIFVLALGGLLSSLILIGIINESPLHDYIPQIVAGLGFVAACWICVAIRRIFARRREHPERGPLSCDELRVARSKLLKDRNRKSV
jgi:hypothetical protein